MDDGHQHRLRGDHPHHHPDDRLGDTLREFPWWEAFDDWCPVAMIQLLLELAGASDVTVWVPNGPNQQVSTTAEVVQNPSITYRANQEIDPHWIAHEYWRHARRR
jgi:hypothetical protein